MTTHSTIARLADTDLQSDPSGLAPTLPYGLEERMVIVRHRREISTARLEAQTPTARYTLAERMTCAYLRHESKDQLERTRYLAEIDAQLRKTRPSAHPRNQRAFLASLGFRGHS